MGQFSVHSNPNPATQDRFPLFVDIQDDLLSFLATRVVIPLTPRDRRGHDMILALAPPLTIEGKHYVLLAPQLMHMREDRLGTVVAALEAERREVLAAVEMIFRGL
jgi:toxin CcdB